MSSSVLLKLQQYKLCQLVIDRQISQQRQTKRKSLWGSTDRSDPRSVLSVTNKR